MTLGWLGWLWDDLGMTLGWPWDDIGMSLGWPWDDLGMTFGWTWDDLGLALLTLDWPCKPLTDLADLWLTLPIDLSYEYFWSFQFRPLLIFTCWNFVTLVDPCDLRVVSQSCDVFFSVKTLISSMECYSLYDILHIQRDSWATQHSDAKISGTGHWYQLQDNFTSLVLQYQVVGPFRRLSNTFYVDLWAITSKIYPYFGAIFSLIWKIVLGY